MKVQINATFNKQNIDGYAIKKENETQIDAIMRSIERRIGNIIYSLKQDHRNSDGSGAQYSGAVVRQNKYAGGYDNMGTITIWT